MSDKQRNGDAKPKLSAWTQEKADRIVSAIASGVYMETAAAYAGVNQWTFKTWLRSGRDGLAKGLDNRYTRLVKAIEEARAQAEVGRVARVADAGRKGQWQADAWWLERTFPERYSLRVRHEGTIQVQPVPLVDLDKLTVGEIEELRRLLRKGAPDTDDPALSESARPALELLPGEVIDGTAEEVDE